jgi:hypothetical protein
MIHGLGPAAVEINTVRGGAVGNRTRTGESMREADYFCQVRFLWRFKRSFLRRLCLLIFALRRFFNEPIR